ncbi:MAG: S-4TM family putative pore-forming effector [Chitinophagales bacterium]
MNSLLKDQNKEPLLRLLKAQNSAYSKAKRYQIIDVISILIALSPTVLLYFDLNHATLVAVIGVIWTLISIFSQILIERETKIGAVIQDQFDTKLFKIDRNEILVGDEIEISKILELSKPNKNDDLTNWYSTKISDNLSHETAVLLAYKCNAIWGKSQRKQFILFIKIMIVLYYGGMIALSLYKNTGLFDLVVWLAPSIPALVFGTSTIKAQNGIVTTYNKINKLVDKLFRDLKDNQNVPTKVELRQIQDLFYTQRLIANKVPDWFYKLFRNRTEGIVDEAIEIMIKE